MNEPNMSELLAPHGTVVGGDGSRTVTLVAVKETKGTVVYQEGDGEREGATFPTIYVQKSALPKPPPPWIEVTVRWGS